METKKAQFLVDVATAIVKAKRIIYVAGKVTGLPAEECAAKFKKAQEALEVKGWTVLNPCEFIENSERWETAMRMALTLLNMADSVYFLPDWKDSEGAKMEFAIAQKLELNMVFE